ncbi:MAG: ornithine cyclodeaminase family protein [Candidatus Dormibacteraceae bacterium]
MSEPAVRPVRGRPHFSREEIMAIDPVRVADAMAAALAMVSRGAAVAPVRAHIDLGEGSGTFIISGVLTELDLLSVKVINVRPQNPGRGLERLQGSLTVFESSTGLPLATLDARAATEVRTAACSAVSLRLLARAGATVMTIFGTGPQAAAHLRAMTSEREFREIRIVGRNAKAAHDLAAKHAGTKAMAAADALRGAHVIVTATNSTSPLFPQSAVEPGTHVVMVGSGGAAASEVEPQLLGRAAAIRVDHRPTCLHESGEIAGALRAGLIDEAAVRELGEVVLGAAPGRTSAHDITVYKSVGNGTQDAALAALLLGISARP